MISLCKARGGYAFGTFPNVFFATKRAGSMLKDLISRTPSDIVDAFHPPPMGDLEFAEAMKEWPDKIVWIGFPGVIHALGPRRNLREAGVYFLISICNRQNYPVPLIMAFSHKHSLLPI